MATDPTKKIEIGLLIAKWGMDKNEREFDNEKIRLCIQELHEAKTPQEFYPRWFELGKYLSCFSQGVGGVTDSNDQGYMDELNKLAQFLFDLPEHPEHYLSCYEIGNSLNDENATTSLYSYAFNYQPPTGRGEEWNGTIVKFIKKNESEKND